MSIVYQNWQRFKTNSETINYLGTLPRYRNTTIRSILCRAKVFFWLAYYRFFNIDRPLFVVLVVNNHCDINCDYCYGSYGERRGYKDYSTTKLLSIIDELWDLGTRLLTIHGGEAMLRKDIGEILNYCKLKGFYVSFNTNGYQIPQRLKEISCVDALVVSLDGLEENNDRHRGIGNYRTAVNALEAGQRAGIPTVISATLTKDNMNDMEHLAELAVKNKSRVQYSILYNSEESRVAGFSMNDPETREVAKKILDLKRSGFPVYYSENVLNTTIHWPASYDKKFTKNDIHENKNFNLVPCYHGKLKYQIDADGRVVECWATAHADAPNIIELGLEKAINTCNKNKTCYHCTLMANNEHNAFMHLSPRNIRNILFIQIADSFKMIKRKYSFLSK